MDPPTRKTIDIRREAKQCPTCGQRFSRDARFCPFDGSKLEAATYDPMGDPLLGMTIDGRYEVVEVLGEGGTGRVYKVRHTTLDRMFAMKLLRRDLASDDELTARFIQEARATASVQHPNVVEITDFGKLEDGMPFLVTELLVGRTLGDLIKAGGPVPAVRATVILRQIASALAAAHAVGIVHRDLKPDNVFLIDATGQGGGHEDVRIVDFGAAKVVGASRVTRDGIIFGTPHYMSPEQASGQPVDHRADIYSLGVIMYEMFTGKVPFEADTYMGVLTQHMFVKPVPPSQVSVAAQGLGALEEVTLVCLAKKPEERYGSMDRLAAEIERATASLGLPAAGRRSAETPRPSRSPEDMAVAFDDGGRPSPPFSEGDAWLPKRVFRWGWLATGALLFGLAAGVLVWIGRKHVDEMRRSSEPTAVSAALGQALPSRPVDSAWSPIAPSSIPSQSALAPGSASPAASAPPTPAVILPVASAAPAPHASQRPPRRAPPRRPAAIDDVGDPFSANR
jgi:serine/threonine protein kinase